MSIPYRHRNRGHAADNFRTSYDQRIAVDETGFERGTNSFPDVLFVRRQFNPVFAAYAADGCALRDSVIPDDDPGAHIDQHLPGHRPPASEAGLQLSQESVSTRGENDNGQPGPSRLRLREHGGKRHPLLQGRLHAREPGCGRDSGRGAGNAIKARVGLAGFNDAGIGIDDAGVVRPRALDDLGVPAFAAAAASARIAP